jgi:hypothetical protein
MKRKPKQQEKAPDVQVPALEQILETFSYHISEIMTGRPIDAISTEYKFGLGLGHGEGCPKVCAIVHVVPSSVWKDPWGVLAETYVNGKPCGNRCGARAEYTRLCAPVIAWVANYWASKNECAERKAV